ncbi:hypothetical protein QYE76_023962 [Lolium multiflorum]|uniref:Uncharacterized protein n=1 Tax=Lolium multiflorum TaxID=4521 RepID=A0AAD8RCQ3_LOLMU|nr:hypothetical protein QYE76_023962 [Lolium multiflorum]
MAEEQITYEDLPPDHKKKYDELKAIVEAELIGSFEKTRSHGIGFKGFTPQGVLDGLDLSLPSDVPEPCDRKSTTWWPIHCIGILRAWAAAALIVAVAAVGAAPSRFFVAAVATSGGTFVVLVFFVDVSIVAVEVAHVARPRADAGRRLVEEASSSSSPPPSPHQRGETIPGEAVVVAFLLRLPNGEEAKVALPVR